MEEFYQYAIKTVLKNKSLERKITSMLEGVPIECELDDSNEILYKIQKDDCYYWSDSKDNYEDICKKIKELVFEEIEEDLERNKIDRYISEYNDDFINLFEKVFEQIGEIDNYKITFKLKERRNNTRLDVIVKIKSLDVFFKF